MKKKSLMPTFRIRILALAIGACASGALGQSRFRELHFPQPNQTYNYQNSMRIFFSDAPATPGTGWLEYKTFTSPRNGHTIKFMDLKHLNGSSSGYCWEIGADYHWPDYTGPDWIIWANTGTASAPVWVMAADDVVKASPRLRVWIQGSVSDGVTRLRLSPYFESLNGSYATYVVRDMKGASEATCMGLTPGIKIVGSSVTLVSPK